MLVCNWLGLYLGVKTCEYFEMKQYSWQGLAEIHTLKGKMKRTMAQFTPKSWTKFEWNSTKNFKSYCTFLFLLTMVSSQMLIYSLPCAVSEGGEKEDI